MYQPRFYRDKMGKGMSSFSIMHKETDLWVAVDNNSYFQELPVKVLDFVEKNRGILDDYIVSNSDFVSSLVPIRISPSSPEIVKLMSDAARLAGVGPMAAVAGTFSELTARYIQTLGVNEVIVENGGDIFLIMQREISLSVYAGESKFSGRLVFKIEPENMPTAVCTSAGTIGHSLSFGNADAVVVLADTGAVADAFATAIANRVKSHKHIPALIEAARDNPHIKGILIVVKDKLGVWGNIQLCSA